MKYCFLKLFFCGLSEELGALSVRRNNHKEHNDLTKNTKSFIINKKNLTINSQ